MRHQTQVRLLRGVPLTPLQTDTITWGSKESQLAYFLTKTAYSFADLTYIKNMPFDIPDQAGQYKNCNYIMFQNPDTPGQWFYAFVTEVEYRADGTTRIHYQLDHIQTWWNDFVFRQCFVVREHVNDDTIGANLIDEGLAYGPYVSNETYYRYFITWWLVIVTAVLFSDQSFPPSEGYVYSGIYSGLAYYCYDLSDISTLGVLLEALAGEGKSDAIVSMYMVPKAIVSAAQESGRPMKDLRAATDMVPPHTDNLDGYVPKNNKLLTYPYKGLRLTNNSGNNVELRYEFLKGNLKVVGNPFPNGRIIMYPEEYEGVKNNFTYAIPLGNYPQCSWTKDVYANWLATQSIAWDYESERRIFNADIGVLTTTTQALSQLAMGNPVGAASTAMRLGSQAISNYQAAQNAQSVMAQEKEIFSMTPPSSRGTSGNDTTMMVLNTYGYVLEERTITRDYAKSIDDYFSMFGYKVNKLKTPNIYGRQSWNYVEAQNAIVTGNAPIEAITEIENAMNNGIRFWHITDVGNFSASNSIS